jgi:predicted nucleic acid-binding protein
MTNRVLLDASFWIALRDAREPFHGRARQLTQELLAARTFFVFTSFILGETHAYFSRSALLRAQILDDAQKNPVMRWEAVSPVDETAAIELLRRHRDKCYSFCDAVSFVLMRRLGIRRVATFDDHFRQIGEFGLIGPEVRL